MNKIEISDVKGFKLEPGKKYLLVFEHGSVTMKDVQEANKYLKEEMNIDSLCIVSYKGLDSLKVIEIPEEIE